MRSRATASQKSAGDEREAGVHEVGRVSVVFVGEEFRLYDVDIGRAALGQLGGERPQHHRGNVDSDDGIADGGGLESELAGPTAELHQAPQQRHLARRVGILFPVVAGDMGGIQILSASVGEFIQAPTKTNGRDLRCRHTLILASGDSLPGAHIAHAYRHLSIALTPYRSARLDRPGAT